MSLRKKLVFTAVLMLLPLVGLEAALRCCGWPTERVRTLSKLLNLDPESYAGTVGMFRPGTTATIAWPPELAYQVSINALGLRGPPTQRRPAPGVTRILALGDSTKWKAGAWFRQVPQAVSQDRQEGSVQQVAARRAFDRGRSGRQVHPQGSSTTLEPQAGRGGRDRDQSAGWLYTAAAERAEGARVSACNSSTETQPK